MMTAELARLLARYNAWQNRSLFDAASGLPDDARREDRGAFFGSIHATLSHLLWGDTIWMSRFAGWDAPKVGIPGSTDWISDWDQLLVTRIAADARIIEWASDRNDGDFAGMLDWYSGALGKDVSRPLGLCVAHFFNHQTHHRGQVHAMLTAAGAKPEATDLFAMPDLA